MGEVGRAVANFANDALTIGTMGVVDAKKGRFYVPFSGASARAGARAIAGINSDIFSAMTGSGANINKRRKTINDAIDSPTGRIAGTAAAMASAIVTGYAAGPAAGMAAGTSISGTTGAMAGAGVAASIAQAEALNKKMPELKVQKPIGNETTAVQQAVSEAASRRSRSRSGRSTVLSSNFLNPSNPGLKEYFGS